MNTSVTNTPVSPRTPISPDSHTPDSQYSHMANVSLASELQVIYDQYKEKEEIYPIFKTLNLSKAVKITDTLQGSVWRAYETRLNKSHHASIIAKVTEKTLHEQKKAVIDKKEYKVSEDIITEQSTLKYITQQKDCPDSIIKYKSFFQTCCE